MLRYRTPDSQLRVKMWLFPVLSVPTAVAIVLILLQMGLDKDIRSQLILSLLSWAVVLVLYFANKWYLNRRPEVAEAGAAEKPHRVLVMANETANSKELLDELRRIGGHRCQVLRRRAGQSNRDGRRRHARTAGRVGGHQQAAQARLDHTLSTLRSDNLDADGALGDYRPLRALANAVDSFHPDQIVIATLPPEYSVWHRFDIVDRARAEHGVPVTHVVATPVEAVQTAR